MKSKLAAAAALALTLSSSVHAQGTLDGLYFKMRMAFGNITQDHFWFLPDGRYMNAVPGDALDPKIFEQHCVKMPTVCGTYKVQGATLQLVPRKGQPETLEFARAADGNLTLAGLFAKRVDKFAPGTKLDGNYSWSGGASGGGTSVSAARGYQFSPDGTFTTKSIAGASADAGRILERSSGAGSGTYKLSGNTLEFTADGKTTRHTAYPYELSANDVRLNIDGEMYKRSR